jgi:hypothetical protein
LCAKALAAASVAAAAAGVSADIWMAGMVLAGVSWTLKAKPTVQR